MFLSIRGRGFCSKVVGDGRDGEQWEEPENTVSEVSTAV